MAASISDHVWSCEEIDCDAIDPEVVPAVGSPEPGGPSIDELAAFLRKLIEHPKARGLALTLYDPSLDSDGSSAKHLVELLGAAMSRDAGETP